MLTERLPYLNLNLGWSIKGLLYLNMNGRYLRGFSTLGPETIERLLYLNLELWATKGLLYLNLYERHPKGFSNLEPWMIERLIFLNLELWVTKGLLYLNLDER